MRNQYCKKIAKGLAALLIAGLLLPGALEVHATQNSNAADAIGKRQEAMNAAGKTQYNAAETTQAPTTREPEEPVEVPEAEQDVIEKPSVAVDEEETGGKKPTSSVAEPDLPKEEQKEEFVDLNGDGINDSSPEDVSNREAAKKEQERKEQERLEEEQKEQEKKEPNKNPLTDQKNEYQAGGQTGNGNSAGDREMDDKTLAAMDAVYRTQIQALSDALPEGTSLVVEQELRGTHYEKALYAAKVIAKTENIRVFDIELQKEDGGTIHQLDDYVEVRMEVPKDYIIGEDNTVVVYYLSEEGETEPCVTTYHGEDPGNRYVTFLTDHFSVYFYMETSREQAAQILDGVGAEAVGTAAAGAAPVLAGYLYLIVVALVIAAVAGVAVVCIVRRKRA
ncbi:MAG: hypothetical protein E7293_01705 [Lachnospiraceae bacterium]|nr:hypothetical protein [Lachnospiraceae bacterium]